MEIVKKKITLPQQQQMRRRGLQSECGEEEEEKRILSIIKHVKEDSFTL